MQFIIIFLTVGILFCILTGHQGYLLYTAAGVLLAASSFLVIMFTYCLVRLILAERKEARFTRVDTPTPTSTHKVAFYQIGDTEYPCLFPEEGILRRRLYRTDRTYRVWLMQKRGRVFDRYSVITIIFGLIAGLTIGIVTFVVHFL